jgi:hypothetical protein
MTKRDLLAVALKVVGVYSLFIAIMWLTRVGFDIARYVTQGPRNENPYVLMGTFAAGSILYFAFALILLGRGDWIARKLVNEDAALPTVGAGESERPIFVLALRIVGAVWVIKGVWMLSTTVARIFSRVGFSTYQLAEIISSGIVLALAAYFLSGGKHLVQLVFKKQRSASAPVDDEVR